jgi:hypothetical protein
MTGPALEEFKPTQAWQDAYLRGEPAAVPAWEDPETREIRTQLGMLLRGGEVPADQRNLLVSVLLRRAGNRQRLLQAMSDTNRALLRALVRLAYDPSETNRLGIPQRTQGELEDETTYSKSYIRELLFGRAKGPDSASQD